jgi:hypothetical protein
MDRLDLFITIHKGLRSALFETTQQVARTDFHDPDASERTASAVRRLVGYLDEHAAHEDRVLMPVIAELSPPLFAELNADHSRVDGLQRELEGLADRLATASEEERVSLGRRLYERIGKLVAEHMLHMDREETSANRLLWAHRTDEELRVLHLAILTSIPPARLVEYAKIMLPSVSPAERTALLGGLQRLLPAEETAEVISIAEKMMSPASVEVRLMASNR